MRIDCKKLAYARKKKRITINNAETVLVYLRFCWDV